MNPESNFAISAPLVLVVITSALTSGIVLLAQGNQAIYISAIAVTAQIVFFTVFLFSMARDTRGRHPLMVVMFIIVNIVSIVVLFGNLYRWVGIKDSLKDSCSLPSFFDAVYFSTVTWTTLGYGDIVPSPDARPIAMIEALTGYVVMGLLIAVLLAMVQSNNTPGN